MNLFKNTGLDREHIIEAVRLIGEDKTTDALELLLHNAADDGVKNAIELALFKVEMPW